MEDISRERMEKRREGKRRETEEERKGQGKEGGEREEEKEDRIEIEEGNKKVMENSGNKTRKRDDETKEFKACSRFSKVSMLILPVI